MKATTRNRSVLCEIFKLVIHLKCIVIQVFQRLNWLGRCFSRSKAIELIPDLVHDLGCDYDFTVKQWKHAQELLSEDIDAQSYELVLKEEESLSDESEEEIITFTTG